MFSRARFQASIGRLREKLRGIEARLLRVPAIQLVARTVRELGNDDASHMAAGVAYYAILSLFPLLVGLIAAFSLFLGTADLREELTEFFGDNLPGTTGEDGVLEENLDAITSQRGAIGLLSVLGLFWAGSAVFGAISKAVNRAWDIHTDRPFYIAKTRQLVMAVGVGILFLLSVSATTALQILGSLVDQVSFLENAAVNLGTRLLPILFTLAIFLAIYKFMPNTKTYWRYVWPGALLAAVLFELAKSIFVLYLDSFANYELVYGQVGSIIALLAWIYISAFILILGAEFASEYGRMREGVGQGVLIATKNPEPPETGVSSDIREGAT